MCESVCSTIFSLILCVCVSVAVNKRFRHEWTSGRALARIIVCILHTREWITFCVLHFHFDMITCGCRTHWHTTFIPKIHFISHSWKRVSLLLSLSISFLPLSASRSSEIAAFGAVHNLQMRDCISSSITDSLYTTLGQCAYIADIDFMCVCCYLSCVSPEWTKCTRRWEIINIQCMHFKSIPPMTQPDRCGKYGLLRRCVHAHPSAYDSKLK